MKKLKQIRKSKGLTMKELGKIIGVTGLTIYRYEAGIRKPNIDLAIKLAETLEVPVKELFTDIQS